MKDKLLVENCFGVPQVAEESKLEEVLNKYQQELQFTREVFTCRQIMFNKSTKYTQFFSKIPVYTVGIVVKC